MSTKQTPPLKKISMLILFTVLVLGMLAPTLSVMAQAGSVATVNTGRLNVRSGPGVSFTIITSVPANTDVILLGRASSGSWVQVQLAGGQQGWMNATRLRTNANLAQLPVTYNTGSTGTPLPSIYTVAAGDTLKTIAAKYGTTWQALAAANNIINPNIIYPGQRLQISYSTQPQPTPVPPPSNTPTYHVVQPGETLQIIAVKYGRTWQQLAASNNLSNPNFVYSGQRLLIPAAPRYYTVRAGDTLAIIALRYGTTIQALSVANNLSNPNTIYTGQTLLVP
ncbi:MAG: LysM peptidoglycan-binding domain-containing protein [Anaerolineae bacterium]